MHSQRKSLNFSQYVPNDQLLNKKVPENPKYKHIKPAVDTGKNVKKQINQLKEKQRNYSNKRDEVFNRVKFSTFIKLAVNVAKNDFSTQLKTNENTEFSSGDHQQNGLNTKKEAFKLHNVLVGIGEIDLRKEKLKANEKSLPRERKVPYLLLDVRDRDQFLEYHIKTAKHYPSAMLSRTNGYEIEEMKHYKNCSPALIILYDDDEVIASRVATTLIQRGYENVYLLTGGLKLGSEIFPPPLMAAICTRRLGGTSTSENFTQNDIEVIHQYIEDYNTIHSNPTNYTRSQFPSKSDVRSHSSFAKCPPSLNFDRNLGFGRRADSACSSKSLDNIRAATSRCAEVARPKTTTIKKAPWK